MNRSIADLGPAAVAAGPLAQGQRIAPHSRRGVAVAGLSLLASLAMVPAAHADTRTFADRAGDTGARADITTVRVSNGAHRVKVAIRPGRVAGGDSFRFWLDTRPKNAGPEYKVEVVANSDNFGLLRVGAFGQQGTPVSCAGLRATADQYAPDWVSISVPRSCLGNPGKVRVAVRGHYRYPGPDVVDWAPAKQKFFGWVAR